MSATGSAHRVRAGAMDQVIVIEQPTLVDGSFGSAQSETWATFATVPAEFLAGSASERFMSDQRYSSRFGVFNIRYLPGILPTFRIQWNGLTWRILGVRDLGRQNKQEVMVEALT